MKPNPVYSRLVRYQLKDSHHRHIVVGKDNIQYITVQQVLIFLGNRLNLPTAVTFHQSWPIDRKLKIISIIFTPNFVTTRQLVEILKKGVSDDTHTHIYIYLLIYI